MKRAVITVVGKDTIGIIARISNYLANNKINILEIRVRSDYRVCGKTLKEIKISDIASVSAVVRNGQIIIPNGDTLLENEDKVLLVTSNENKEKVAKLFQRKKHEG